jgi:hypothetical protein
MTNSFTLQALASMRSTAPYMNLDHHSEFLACLIEIQYLNTYSLSSYFTVANGLIVAKSQHRDLQSRHEI